MEHFREKLVLEELLRPTGWAARVKRTGAGVECRVPRHQVFLFSIPFAVILSIVAAYYVFAYDWRNIPFGPAIVTILVGVAWTVVVGLFFHRGRVNVREGMELSLVSVYLYPSSQLTGIQARRDDKLPPPVVAGFGIVWRDGEAIQILSMRRHRADIDADVKRCENIGFHVRNMDSTCVLAQCASRWL